MLVFALTDSCLFLLALSSCFFLSSRTSLTLVIRLFPSEEQQLRSNLFFLSEAELDSQVDFLLTFVSASQPEGHWRSQVLELCEQSTLAGVLLLLLLKSTTEQEGMLRGIGIAVLLVLAVLRSVKPSSCPRDSLLEIRTYHLAEDSHSQRTLETSHRLLLTQLDLDIKMYSSFGNNSYIQLQTDSTTVWRYHLFSTDPSASPILYHHSHQLNLSPFSRLVLEIDELVVSGTIQLSLCHLSSTEIHRY